MKIRFLLLLSAGLFALTSCNKDEDNTAKQAEEDKAIILQYITENNLTAQSTASGLYYVTDDQGTGQKPTINSEVTVKYKGYLTDGTVFDQSYSSTFKLSNVIDGWKEGIPLYNTGGSGVLLIPSALGYGDRSIGNIPSNSVLIFDIELLKIK